MAVQQRGGTRVKSRGDKAEEFHSAPSVHGERDLHVPRCGQGKVWAGLECGRTHSGWNCLWLPRKVVRVAGLSSRRRPYKVTRPCLVHICLMVGGRYWFPDSNKPRQSRFNLLRRLAATFDSLIIKINSLPGILVVLTYRLLNSRDENYKCIH